MHGRGIILKHVKVASNYMQIVYLAYSFFRLRT